MNFMEIVTYTNILTGKINATVKCCHALHVAHKQELRMLTLS